MIHEFLAAHSCPSEHCESPILELSCLHVGECLGFGGLEVERIESNITRIIIVSQLPECFRPIGEIGLDPSDRSTLQFCGGNAQCQQDERRQRNLLQLIIRGSIDSKGRRKLLAGKISDACDHCDATVHDFGLAISLDLVEGDASLGKAKGIKEASRWQSSRQTVAWQRLVSHPTVDCHGGNSRSGSSGRLGGGSKIGSILR